MAAVERVGDATTGARVRVRHGAREPTAAEVAQVARQSRELSEGARETGTLIPVRTDLTGPEDSVLEPAPGGGGAQGHHVAAPTHAWSRTGFGLPPQPKITTGGR